VYLALDTFYFCNEGSLFQRSFEVQAQALKPTRPNLEPISKGSCPGQSSSWCSSNSLV